MSTTHDSKIVGGCICGAVQYEIGPNLGRFQYCHCSRCRKGSGSAFATNLFVPEDSFRWVKGREAVKLYELPQAKFWCAAFCTHCGSSMPWPTKGTGHYAIPAGTLDEDPGVTPSRNVFFGSRAPWYVQPGELETFETYPQRPSRPGT